MKVPTYILGFLKRYGPLHGYKLKGLISDMVSDFTSIKLPTIYYHLEKMEEKGLVSAEREQEGKRPERSVYSITEQGEEEFLSLVSKTLWQSYHPEFEIDAALFFYDSTDKRELESAIERHINNCTKVITQLKEHKKEVMAFVPEEARASAMALFHHHEVHYEAEMEWLKRTRKDLFD
jgi:DNA-binding PadR family transcriptional regulator